MSAAGSVVQASRPDLGPSRGRRRRVIGLTLVVSCGFLVLGLQGPRRRYTCAVCRMDRVDRHALGLKWSDQEATDCSRWYTENVERSHEHEWVECTRCQWSGVPGLWGGYRCYIGGPITGLSRSVQVQIYEHFEDRLKAKRLFIRLGRSRGEGRLRLWDALMDWVDQGYPGAWDDGWESAPSSGRLAFRP